MTDAPVITDATRLRRKPGLVGADVADDAILLDIDSGYFFQLNRTGSKIWSLVAEPQDLRTLCDRMAGSFRIDPETCRRDVTEFVADLLERGVLEIESA